MRFLLPLIIVGALLASQMVYAESSRTPCFTVIERLRAERLIEHNLAATCDPSFIPSRSELQLCPHTLARSLARRAIRLNVLPLCLPSNSTVLPGETSSSSSSVASSVSSSSSSSTSTSATFDTRDTELRSQLLLLGEVSPILGAASIFSNDEALDVRTVTIALTNTIPSVQSLLVYDDTGRYIGRAVQTPSISSKHYVLTITPGTYLIPRREQRGIYARADMQSFINGGSSGADTQIASVTIGGTGEWSSHTYSVQSSTNTFPRFLTSRSAIVSVTTPTGTTAPLVPGSQKTIGAFRFTGRTTDSQAKLEMTDLVFTLSTSNVTLTNVRLGADGTTDRVDCTVGASSVTCSSIPASHGSLTDTSRTLTLYGDVTVTGGTSASLILSLNEQGSATSDGSITWTDGTTTFTWVPLGSVGGVANGTYYSY